MWPTGTRAPRRRARRAEGLRKECTWGLEERKGQCGWNGEGVRMVCGELGQGGRTGSYKHLCQGGVEAGAQSGGARY